MAKPTDGESKPQNKIKNILWKYAFWSIVSQ